MWGYDIEYAGIRARTKHMYVVRRPDIPAPIKRYAEVEIPGRDGKSYIDEETIEDIVIDVELNFLGEPDKWFGHFRIAKKWLLKSENKELQFGDDMKFYYKVKKVEIQTAERVCYEIGKFTVSFYCEGYQYVKEGAKELPVKEVLYNPYDVSRPVYHISGQGACELVINGNTMKAEVNGELYIDTERKITYNGNKEIRNTSVSGDYDMICLAEGDNTILCGFDLTVTPNWRCL